jgi:hypothetical protein
MRRFDRAGWRTIVLASLAGWATLISIESLWRPPGSPVRSGLPPSLLLEGRRLPRRDAARPSAKLPEGISLLEAAHYGPVRLLHLAHGRTGRSGGMPVEAINEALTGSAGGGACLLLTAEGSISREMATQNEWAAVLHPRPPSPLQRLAWLAGLRPYRVNACLWRERPGS